MGRLLCAIQKLQELFGIESSKVLHETTVVFAEMVEPYS